MTQERNQALYVRAVVFMREHDIPCTTSFRDFLEWLETPGEGWGAIRSVTRVERGIMHSRSVGMPLEYILALMLLDARIDGPYLFICEERRLCIKAEDGVLTKMLLGEA